MSLTLKHDPTATTVLEYPTANGTLALLSDIASSSSNLSLLADSAISAGAAVSLKANGLLEATTGVVIPQGLSTGNSLAITMPSVTAPQSQNTCTIAYYATHDLFLVITSQGLGGFPSPTIQYQTLRFTNGVATVLASGQLTPPNNTYIAEVAAVFCPDIGKVLLAYTTSVAIKLAFVEVSADGATVTVQNETMIESQVAYSLALSYGGGKWLLGSSPSPYLSNQRLYAGNFSNNAFNITVAQTLPGTDTWTNSITYSEADACFYRARLTWASDVIYLQKVTIDGANQLAVLNETAVTSSGYQGICLVDVPYAGKRCLLYTFWGNSGNSEWREVSGSSSFTVSSATAITSLGTGTIYGFQAAYSSAGKYVVVLEHRGTGLFYKVLTLAASSSNYLTYVGVAMAAVTVGQTVQVQTTGVVTVPHSIPAASKVYVQPDGTFSATATSVPAGIALANNKLLLKG